MSRPEALDWSIENCTVQRALQVLGDRWSFVVLREVFNGVRRFDDMRTRTAIPRQVLSDRLGRLVEEGLLRREPYREEGQRPRLEYRLTDKGLDLYPVFVALNEWGSRYYADADGSPLAFRAPRLRRGGGDGPALRGRARGGRGPGGGHGAGTRCPPPRQRLTG